MQTMPKVIHGLNCEGIGVPTIPHAEWHAKLADAAGRPLTADETAMADKMGDHNWTLRVVVAELFGDAAADAFFARKVTCNEHAQSVTGELARTPLPTRGSI